MAQVLKDDNEICIISGDVISFKVLTEGDIQAEVGDTAQFMIKKLVSDADVDAIFSKNINVITAGEIPVYAESIETEDLPNGSYYWSVKHVHDGQSYTIIPDTCFGYPLFRIREVLING